MPSIVVVVVPLLLGYWIGSNTNFWVGAAVWFATSWILGMVWQADRRSVTRPSPSGGSTGVFDNMAIRRTEMNLRPFMRADERIVEYDICDVTGLGSRMPVVLTNRATYFMAPTTIRLPYEHIIDLQARGRLMIGIATKSGNAYMLQVVGTPKGDLYGTIAHHLDRIIKHKQTVEVPEGQVIAICRTLEEDQPPQWVMQTTEGISLDDPAVRAVLGRELQDASDQYRADLPW